MGELVEIAWVCPIFRQREGTMNRWKNRWNRLLTAAVLGLLLAGLAAADTLELKDGRVLRGKYLGGTQAVLRFEVNGEVQNRLRAAKRSEEHTSELQSHLNIVCRL